MQTKLKFALCVVNLLINVTVISGCMYEKQQYKPTVYKFNETKQQISETKQQEKEQLVEQKELLQNNTKIETETDREVDIQATAPVRDKVAFNLTDYERWVVECMVMGESGGEPYEGQMLIAQCILNACLKDNIQPSEVKTIYKYSGWKENPTKSVKKAVSSVFDLGEKIVDEPILYFYAPLLCQSKWHETQIFVVEFGGHRFFKEKVLRKITKDVLKKLRQKKDMEILLFLDLTIKRKTINII